MGGGGNGNHGGGNSCGSNCYSIFNNNGTIDYRGSWVSNSFTTPNSQNQQQSFDTADTNASIAVNFAGSQIQVLGMIRPDEDVILANYSIDGGDWTTRSVPGIAQDTPLFYQTFYSSPVLENGLHNITVQMVEIGGGRNYSFLVFNVQTPEDDSPNKNKGADSKSSDKHGNSGSSGAAAIVGGVLGSVIFLLLAVLLAFYLWRKRRLAQMSRAGPERLVPAMYYTRPVSGGEKQFFTLEPAPVINRDPRFSVAAARNASGNSRLSWVSVHAPPTVPGSALLDNRPISDWSSYRQQSLIVQQWHPELSRFSPYTSTSLSPMAFGNQTPRRAASRRAGPPSQIDTPATSMPSLPRRLSESERF